MNHQFKLKCLAGSIAGAFFALDASMAFAALEEVIVTARKRQESLQDVPVVVQALTAEALEANGTTTFQDLNDQVTGLQIQNTGAVAPQINLRGVTGDSTNVATDNAVSINLDGVQHSSAQLLRFGLFELASAEVLKGPQALFFGKNSPGGIVALKTKSPTEEFFSEVQAGYEEAAERKYGHIILSGPLTDNWGGRIGVKYTDQEGFFENIWGKGDTTVSRPFEQYGPNFDSTVVAGTLQGNFDRGGLSFKVYRAEQDGADYTQTDLFGDCADVPNLTNPYSDCTVNDKYSAAPWSDASGSRFGANEPTFDYELTQLTLEANYEINDTWEFNNILGWIEIENSLFGNVGARNNGDAPDVSATTGTLALGNAAVIESISEEFRFSGDFDNFRVMFGAFLDDRETNSGANVWISPTSRIRPDAEVSVEGESWSVFAQTDIDLTEQLELSIGARYTEEERSISGRNFETLGSRVEGPHFFLNPEREYTNLSPELTLSWRPAEDVTLFASYKEGFKSGGYNSSTLDGSSTNRATGPAPIDQSFKPENVSGYELGAKLELLDNNLRVNAAAYNYSFTEMQLTQVRVVDGAPDVSTVNAGESTIRGFEVDFLWQTAWEPLMVSGNFAWSEGEFDEFIQQCNQYQLNVDPAGCNVDVDNSLATDAGGLVAGTGFDAQDRAGTPLRAAPEYNGTLNLIFDTELSDTVRFRANVSASWKDEAQLGGENDPRFVADAYWTYNGRLGVYAEDESWAVDLIGRNLSDADEPINLFYNSRQIDPVLGGTQPAALRINPREIAIQFTFRPDLFF